MALWLSFFFVLFLLTVCRLEEEGEDGMAGTSRLVSFRLILSYPVSVHEHRTRQIPGCGDQGRFWLLEAVGRQDRERATGRKRVDGRKSGWVGTYYDSSSSSRKRRRRRRRR